MYMADKFKPFLLDSVGKKISHFLNRGSYVKIKTLKLQLSGLYF